MIFQLFSSITPPYPTTVPSDPTDALITLLNFGLRILFVAAGLLALWNFVFAGFKLIGSGGDAKALESVRDKLVWTFIGLLVMVSAIVVAGLIGIIVYGKWDAIINPQFTTP